MAQGFTHHNFVKALIQFQSPVAQPTNLSASGTARALGTSVVSGAANTKGSYATLITPTQVTTGLYVSVSEIAGTTLVRGSFMDIAWGASDTIVIPDLNTSAAGTLNTTATGKHFFFPGLSIPANEAIKARHQCSTATITARVTVFAVHNAVWNIPTSTYITYGANLTDSSGVAVTPGADSFGTAINIGTTTRNHYAHIVGRDLDVDASGGVTNGTLGELLVGPDLANLVSMGFFRVSESSNEELSHSVDTIYYATTSGDLLWVRLAAASAAEIRGITITSN